jgi:N6-adenosine-specific RNA methylase IME4/ParB-like chromosome segregation protein Spo0J
MGEARQRKKSDQNDLARLGFGVRRYRDQAALDDDTGQSRVPPMGHATVDDAAVVPAGSRPKYEAHPAAELVPLLEGEAFDALVADIKTKGLLHPITLFEDKILDGRNRFRACLEAAVEPRFGAYQGEDPVAFVISANIERRHLDESQRAMCAARLATLKRGSNQHSVEGAHICAPSQGEAATRLLVSRRLVQRAREVLDSGEPELVRAVDRGAIAVSLAADLVKQSRETQLEAAREPTRAPLLIKQKVRAEKEAALAQRQLALPNERFGVVYANPPWRFEPYSRETGLNIAPDNHYATATLQAITELDVASIAADDSVLLIWATVPMLPQALETLRVPGTQASSLVLAPVGSHSEKPEVFCRLIEDYFPNLPKIELFARRRREGWRVWGAEAPEGSDDLSTRFKESGS